MILSYVAKQEYTKGFKVIYRNCLFKELIIKPINA